MFSVVILDIVNFLLYSEVCKAKDTCIQNVEAVAQRYSVKKVFLEISQNSQESTCASFLTNLQTEACNFIKKNTLTQVFSCEFCEISKKTFLKEHLWWLLLKMLFLYFFFLCIIFFFISLKKVWKFGYLVFFARINFREFVLAKNLTEINIRKITNNLRNLRKLLLAISTSLKVYDSLPLSSSFTMEVN